MSGITVVRQQKLTIKSSWSNCQLKLTSPSLGFRPQLWPSESCSGSALGTERNHHHYHHLLLAFFHIYIPYLGLVVLESHWDTPPETEWLHHQSRSHRSLCQKYPSKSESNQPETATGGRRWLTKFSRDLKNRTSAHKRPPHLLYIFLSYRTRWLNQFLSRLLLYLNSYVKRTTTGRKQREWRFHSSIFLHLFICYTSIFFRVRGLEPVPAVI